MRYIYESSINIPIEYYLMAFMPHPLIEPYIKWFIEKDDDILIWNASKSYREAFGEGNLMVTDYSSVAFHFAYLDKPILYYHFDKEEFYAKHTYNPGYFDYERDGFGSVVKHGEQLVKHIMDYIENSESYHDSGKSSVDNFIHRKNVCEAIYNKIINIGV